MQDDSTMDPARLILSDLCRYIGQNNATIKSFAKEYALNSGFKYQVWLRLCLSVNPLLRGAARVQRFRLARKFNLQIPLATPIGYGLYLGHGNSVIVSPFAEIGNNVNLSQFVTIGGKKSRAAVIGDNVYIGPGACIVGGVTIGDNCRVGAGAVVTRDVRPNSTVAGVPAVEIAYGIEPNPDVNNRYRPSKAK